MSKLSHRAEVSLAASPQRVFGALSEPAQLREWFAEFAEVEPRVDGSFAFWGRYSYGIHERPQPVPRLSAFEPARRLAFTYRVDGVDSSVTFELAEDDSEKNRGGTRLVILHEFAQAPAIGRARELIDDLWRIHAGNLQAWLSNPAAITRVDFTDPAPSVSATILIDAPVERVYASFLDPSMLDRWIASAAIVDPVVGGRYSYGWSYTIDERKVAGGPARIIEMVPNRKLVTDWPDWRGDDSVPAQRITWLFEAEGNGTRVRVIHDRFVRAVDISDYPFGWPAFLGMLAPVFPSADT